MIRSLQCLLVLLTLTLVASPASAQYEVLQKKLRESWDKVVPEKGEEVVSVEYSTANSLFANNGRSMGGGGVLLPGGIRSAFVFKESGKRYEILQKGQLRAFRVGKADFKRTEPADTKQHTVLLSFVHPAELVQQLMRNVSSIRPGRTLNIRGKPCRHYRVTYQESNIRALLRQLGLTEQTMSGRKRKKTGLEADFYIEVKSGRLRELHVSFRVEVKQGKKAKPAKKKNWSWESYDSGDSMMRAGTREEGKDPSAVGREARSTVRQYSLKATFLTPAVPKKPLELPDQAKKLLNWGR